MRYFNHSLSVFLCLAATWPVAAVLSSCSDSHAEGDAGPAVPPPEVVVVTLKTQPVPLTRELPGRTRASVFAEVRPQVSGIVKRRLFAEGSIVKAGQPLYEIDDATYRAQHESAKAKVRKAQAALRVAQLAASRSRELARVYVVSAQVNENAIAVEEQAQADLEVALTALASTGVSLSHAHIVAPISGRIGKSTVTEGALVTAEQVNALATIQQLDPVYVELNESSVDWLALKQAIDDGRVKSSGVGATAKILLENGTLYGHLGKVQFSDVTVDTTTGNFLLRAIVPNPSGLLMPGMYVRAVVNEGTLTDGVLVPQQAVTMEPKGNASALIVSKEGKVERRELRVSRTIGDRLIVEKGLIAGDRVIVEGVQKVQPGMPVKAVEKAAVAAADSHTPVVSLAQVSMPVAAR